MSYFDTDTDITFGGNITVEGSLNPESVFTPGSGVSAMERNVSGVFQAGDIITTRIVIDLTGLVGSATDLDIIGNTPPEFAAFLKRDIAQWSRVIQGAKIKAD